MDCVRAVEVTIRTYERREAAGVADVFYKDRSAKSVTVSAQMADPTPVRADLYVPVLVVYEVTIC